MSIIQARLDGGKRNKAMRGALYGNLPSAYVQNGEQLLKNPDRQVQASIERVFSAFLEAGSARAAGQLLRDSGVRLPVRRHGEVSWRDAGYGRIQMILKNPMMAGVYAWARQGGPVDGPLCEQWRVWIPDHHEAYVDLPTWYRIQEQLFRNQGKRASDRGALREGPALLQGLAVCGHCGRSMGSRYNKSWRYICLGRMNNLGQYDS